jgi:hypothetical protein
MIQKKEILCKRLFTNVPQCNTLFKIPMPLTKQAPFGDISAGILELQMSKHSCVAFRK